MSSLNIFMKNNKGYYSWIHALKEAALISQKKGYEMLNEQYKPDFKEIEKALKKPGEAPVINPNYPSDASKTSEQIYDEIKDVKVSRGEQRNLSKNIGKDPDAGKVDLKPLGDAQAVEDDGSDHIIGNNAVDPSLVRRTSKVGREARAETGATTPEDIEDERLEAAAEKYEEDQSTKQEEVEGIIDRLMRGKR